MALNGDISRVLQLYAELLLLHGKDARLSDLLSGAAYRIRRMDEDVTQQTKAGLNSLFKPPVVQILEEIKATSTIAVMDELVQVTPQGLFDMMRIKGLGGHKLAVLWKTAKIDNVEDLLKACKAGKLRSIQGFGAKTEANIIAAIEAFNSSAERFHYADVADSAASLVAALQKHFKTKYISLCGEVRRQATTVEAIEIIAAVSAAQFTSVKKWLTVASSQDVMTRGHTLDEIPITIYHTNEKNYHKELFVRTGSEAHVARLLPKIKGAVTSETALYKKAGLPFIEPELREDVAEWDYTKNPKPLLSVDDIKGVVHNHTTWSDGVDTLEAFVNACRKKGYQYTVISDHSKNAHYAGGLKPDKVLRQMEAIDALNKKVQPFKIFKSIECDICVSGDLDYDSSLLKQFDLVIISIHQQLKMAEAKATARLIKAIENPYTTILGHMSGRQLLIRPGYPVDFKKVIDACSANGVVIELNANPYRLDMDWSHIPYALEKSVMISINPDAHSIHEIDNIRWGVTAARKGGLTKEMTWNAMPLAGIKKWLSKKHSQHDGTGKIQS